MLNEKVVLKGRLGKDEIGNSEVRDRDRLSMICVAVIELSDQDQSFSQKSINRLLALLTLLSLGCFYFACQQKPSQ